jgi:hypothetical protein
VHANFPVNNSTAERKLPISDVGHTELAMDNSAAMDKISAEPEFKKSTGIKVNVYPNGRYNISKGTCHSKPYGALSGTVRLGEGAPELTKRFRRFIEDGGKPSQFSNQVV